MYLVIELCVRFTYIYIENWKCVLNTLNLCSVFVPSLCVFMRVDLWGPARMSCEVRRKLEKSLLAVFGSRLSVQQPHPPIGPRGRVPRENIDVVAMSVRPARVT